MTLDDIPNARNLLECVDILSVVLQKFSVALDTPNEFVTWRRLELAGVDLTGELKKWSRVFLEILNVKHGLWVGKVRKVGGKSGVHPVTGPEVRDAAGDGDPGPGQDDDVAALPDNLDAVLKSVESLQLLPPRGL